MTPHEYSVVGHSRSRIGRWLYVGAAAGASVLTTAGLTLGNAFAARGLPAWLHVSLVAPVSAVAVFGTVHWVFGKHDTAGVPCAGSRRCRISRGRGGARARRGTMTGPWRTSGTRPSYCSPDIPLP